MIIEQLRNVLILGVLLIIVVFINIEFFSYDLLSEKNEYSQRDDVKKVYSDLEIEGDYEDCLQKYVEQKKYFDEETLSEEFTFDKYKTIYSKPETLADLDLNFSKTARRFRTNIRYGLEGGVNFDGKYTIAGVGMTGRGNTNWIIDRTNGKAYELPFTGLGIHYEKDSNLIIISPRSMIEKASYHKLEKKYDCWSFIEGGRTIKIYDLIPHYFLWENNKLRHLGPKEYEPLLDLFWESYSI